MFSPSSSLQGTPRAKVKRLKTGAFRTRPAGKNVQRWKILPGDRGIMKEAGERSWTEVR